MLVGRVFERGCTPDHAVAWNAVDLLADRAHEVTTAARGDVVREPVRLQVAEQLDHRRVRALEIPTAERRVLRRAEERVRLRLELVDADPAVGSKDAGQERPHVRVIAGVVLGEHLAQPRVVTLVRGLPGLAASQLGVGIGHLIETSENEVRLNRQRLLAPQRAVVVERRDPLRHRNERRTILGHRRDEIEDRLFRRAVFPGCKHSVTCRSYSRQSFALRSDGAPAAVRAFAPRTPRPARAAGQTGR